MKKGNLLMLVAAATFALTACNSAADKQVETTEAQEAASTHEAHSYAVASGSQVEWKGFKTNVDWSHHGTINVTEGSFNVKDDQLVGGKFTIDMTSMVATDMVGKEKYNDLMGHLASPDFFDVANHPNAEFEITGVEAMPNAETGTSHKVMGNLTMRGVTKNIAFNANVTISPDAVMLSAPEFGLDRKQWNVMYNSTGAANVAAMTKDQFIDDTILLWMNISAAPTAVASN